MFIDNLKKVTSENNNFRRVLYTGQYSQIVAMSIPVGEDIGDEVHMHTDQILFFVHGECEAVLDGVKTVVKEQDIVYVPAGTRHNFINNGDEDLKLFTVYSPPEHRDGTIHKTKADAHKGGEG